MYSIDDNYSIGSTNYPNLTVQNTIQEDEKDFNYNDLSTKEISIKKLPYINRNCEIFHNSDVDLLDLLRSDTVSLDELTSVKRKEINSKLKIIMGYIIELISGGFESDSLYINIKKLSVMEERLGECALSLTKCMKNDLDMVITKAYDFLLEAERYVDELSDIDIFKFFFE